MVASTGCNSRRPGFDFQHPYCNLKPSMVPVPGDPTLLASVGTEHMWCMDTHAGKSTHTHKIKAIENPNMATFLRKTAQERVYTRRSSMSELVLIPERCTGSEAALWPGFDIKYEIEQIAGKIKVKGE